MAEGSSSETRLISNSSTTLLMRLLIESLEEAFGYNCNIPRKELSSFYVSAYEGINEITKIPKPNSFFKLIQAENEKLGKGGGKKLVFSKLHCQYHEAAKRYFNFPNNKNVQFVVENPHEDIPSWRQNIKSIGTNLEDVDVRNFFNELIDEMPNVTFKDVFELKVQCGPRKITAEIEKEDDFGDPIFIGQIEAKLYVKPPEMVICDSPNFITELEEKKNGMIIHHLKLDIGSLLKAKCMAYFEYQICCKFGNNGFVQKKIFESAKFSVTISGDKFLYEKLPVSLSTEIQEAFQKERSVRSIEVSQDQKFNIEYCPSETYTANNSVQKTKIVAELKQMNLLDVEDNIGIRLKSSDIQKATISSKHSDVYLMSQEYKGNCLIINNVNFKVAWLGERIGSDMDAHNLTTLYTTLGFLIKQYDDLEGKKMKDKIKKFSKNMNSKGQMCIIILLSHGLNGAIYGTDGIEVSNGLIIH